MFTGYEHDQPPGRQHPWTVVVANPTDQYVDFKTHPDQIPLALPDFIPWAHYPAIQTFYGLLAWLNGPESVFESNDCGLRPPRVDPNTPEMVRPVFAADPIVVHCRLTILYRDLARNTSAETVDALKRAIHDGLRDQVPNMPAAVTLGDWEHDFMEIGQRGRAITLLIWAWGEDEAAAMAQLDYTVSAIHGCLLWISDAVMAQEP